MLGAANPRFPPFAALNGPKARAESIAAKVTFAHTHQNPYVSLTPRKDTEIRIKFGPVSICIIGVNWLRR